MVMIYIINKLLKEFLFDVAIHAQTDQLIQFDLSIEISHYGDNSFNSHLIRVNLRKNSLLDFNMY